MSYYELRRNMQTGDLTGAWIGTNQDGMSSDDGVFEFVFIPVDGPEYLWCRNCEAIVDPMMGRCQGNGMGKCDIVTVVLVGVGEEQG